MRLATFVIVLMALLAACTGQNRPGAQQQQPTSPQLDADSLGRALLEQSEVPAELAQVDTMTIGTKETQFGVNDAARAGQVQPLPGVTWEPAECSSMLEAGFEQISDLTGLVRLYATDQAGNKEAGGGVQGGLVASAVVDTRSSPFQPDLVRRKLDRCESASVTLDAFGGAVGRISQQETEAPQVDGAKQTLAWRQTVTFDTELPAEARAFAELFNAEAVYLDGGDALVWVSTAGTVEVSAAELAGTAMDRARRELRLR